MPLIQVGDEIKRDRQNYPTMVLYEGVWIKGKKNGDPYERHYCVEAIGNCGRVCLTDLTSHQSNLYCALFRDWSTFDLWREGFCIGSAEHTRKAKRRKV